MCILAIGNLFSGEESYGKYLDLYTNHTAYNNLRHVPKRVAYLQYLDVLIYAQNDMVHTELPRECRITGDYEKYVTQPSLFLFATGTQARVAVISEVCTGILRRSCGGRSHSQIVSRNVSSRRRNLRRNGRLVRSMDGKTKLLPKPNRMVAKRAFGVQLVGSPSNSIGSGSCS